MEEALTPKEKKAYDVFTVIFASILIWQGAHMVEHIAQVIQKFVLHRVRAHGIVGRFDVEWVHFGYNIGLLAATYLLFLGYTRFLRSGSGKKIPKTFLAAVIVQSYHMFEHTLKIMQHLETGKQGTPGFLGNFFNLIWLHFWINLVVFILVAAPFFQLGLHRHFLRMIKERALAPAKNA